MPRWLLVVTTAALAVGLVRSSGAVPAPAPVPPAADAFVVSAERSSVRVHVGKTGVLSFAGHRHEIAAPVTGTINADAGNLARSGVELRFATAAFRVLPEGEPDGDAPKIQEVMLGTRVLDAVRFGEVLFRSRAVSGRDLGAGRYELQVSGDLTVHGVTREIVVPVSVVVDADALSAHARCTINHAQFGLTPVTAAGGTVRVRDEIEIDFAIAAERRR